MAWVSLGSVYGWDLNGAGYALLGQLYYEPAQDIAGNRTQCKIDAYKYAAGGRIDEDVRAWSILVSGAGGATGAGSIGGNAAPRFDGMSAGQTAFMFGSDGFWINHAADGTAQITAVAQWAATSGGSWFDAGFYGTAGPIALPSIPRGAMERYDGSGWESQMLDRHDGSGFELQKLERYTGSSWVGQK